MTDRERLQKISEVYMDWRLVLMRMTEEETYNQGAAVDAKFYEQMSKLLEGIEYEL